MVQAGRVESQRRIEKVLVAVVLVDFGTPGMETSAVRSVWWCGSEGEEVGLSLLLPEV